MRGQQLKLSSGDRQVMGLGSLIFSFFALVFACIAIVVATQAWSRSNDAKDATRKLAAGTLLSNQATVRLQEYSMVVSPATVKAGKVKFTIHNVGTVTHEMVLVRAPDAASLPRVAVATSDRAVGDVNEEAIPEADLPGEAQVKAGATVTKTIGLTPGTYVMICNIDTKTSGGQVLNHFQRGMYTTITAS